MDIIIGESPRIGASNHYMREGDGPLSMEASFLEVTETRDQGGAGRSSRGRVLSVLIPEGQTLPRGLESGEYRIYLRFVHRRPAKY